jgi:hypothetical protein
MNDRTASSVQIYSPAQICIACLLGSPLAASWLMALTYGAIEEKKKAKSSLIYGAAGTAAVVALSFVLPESVPSAALPIGYTIGVFHVAKQLQGPIVAAHRARGGKIGSWGFAVGVGALGLGIVFAAIAGITFLLPRHE